MGMQILILAVSFVIAISLTGVSGQIYCHSCSSFTDLNRTACLDPVSLDVPIIVCPSGYVCSKVTYVTNKVFVTLRGCDPGTNTCSTIRNDLQIHYPDLSSFTCYWCNKNFCNKNSGNSGVTIVLSFVTLFCGIMFTKVL